MRSFLFLGAIVFAASVLGLASSHAFSVSFWPANAVLVGCAIRDRRLGCGFGWVGAFIGFVAADLLFGRTLSLAVFFAGANLIGALTATMVLRRLPADDLALRREHSVPRILACLIPACVAAALAGALLVKVQFGGSALQTLLTWPASELVNYLVVLPAMLTFRRAEPRSRTTPRAATRPGPWPILLLALSCAATVHFDGPGSIMFPLPALLLCALAYPVPVVALLTLALGAGALITLGLGIVDMGQDMAVPAMVVSVRIAVAFLVLVPLTIASVMAVRDDLLGQLKHAAEHDGLTGLLNRRTFEQRMVARLAAPIVPGSGHVLLWLDIDHFKAVNDSYGHPAGDAVLQAFAAIARDCCHTGDLIGRIGGEEFAILARVAGPREAHSIAECLRRSFASFPTRWNGVAIRATVSVGAAFIDRAPDMDDLGAHLDKALYRAKRRGRDRIEWVAIGLDERHGRVSPGTDLELAARTLRFGQAIPCPGKSTPAADMFFTPPTRAASRSAAT